MLRKQKVGGLKKFGAELYKAGGGREATASGVTGCDELLWWFGGNISHVGIMKKDCFK